MPSPKMKHCPFCGENNVRMTKRSKGGPELEVVECVNCGAAVYAPSGYPQDAIKRWNTRVLDVSIDELQLLNRFMERAAADRMSIMLDSYKRCGTFGPDFESDLLWPLENVSNTSFRLRKLITAMFGERSLQKEKKK